MQAYVRLDANLFGIYVLLQRKIWNQLSPNPGICVKQLGPSLDILSEPKEHVLANYKLVDSQRISGVQLTLWS